MRDKYIVYVSPNVNKDGAEKSLCALQSYMNSLSIKTIVIIPKHGNIEELFKKNNIQYMIHRFEGSINAGQGIRLVRGFAKYAINWVQATRMKFLFQKEKIEVLGIHTNVIVSDFGHYLALKLKVPHIWHIREFGKLDFNFDFELGMEYMRRCANKAAIIICNSKAVMNYYSQYFNNELLICIYNGVPLLPNGPNEWATETFRMIMIGRLSSEKGQEIAIYICKRMLDAGYSDFVLDLYGEGTDKEKLRRTIDIFSLSGKVNIKGYSSSIPINKYHVGLTLSHHEAFGRSTVEYMVNSLPVVGVNTGGTSEIIDNGNTGYLFQIDNTEHLFSIIKKLYQDRETCRKMGLCGRKKALDMFGEEMYCKNIHQVYQKIFGAGVAERGKDKCGYNNI